MSKSDQAPNKLTSEQFFRMFFKAVLVQKGRVDGEPMACPACGARAYSGNDLHLLYTCSECGLIADDNCYGCCKDGETKNLYAMWREIETVLGRIKNVVDLPINIMEKMKEWESQKL